MATHGTAYNYKHAHLPTLLCLFNHFREIVASSSWMLLLLLDGFGWEWRFMDKNKEEMVVGLVVITEEDNYSNVQNKQAGRIPLTWRLLLPRLVKSLQSFTFLLLSFSFCLPPRPTSSLFPIKPSDRTARWRRSGGYRTVWSRLTSHLSRQSRHFFFLYYSSFDFCTCFIYFLELVFWQVWYEFFYWKQSPDGDLIDCVASHRQPSFDHPRLQGKKPLVPELPLLEN